jgi:hypothetical protein
MTEKHYADLAPSYARGGDGSANTLKLRENPIIWRESAATPWRITPPATVYAVLMGSRDPRLRGGHTDHGASGRGDNSYIYEIA